MQKILPLLNSPNAMRFFQDKLQGLQSGALSIQDIRRDAIKARDQVKALTKGLGPEADQALADYVTPDVLAAVEQLRRRGVEFIESPGVHTERRGALTKGQMGGVMFELVQHTPVGDE